MSNIIKKDTPIKDAEYILRLHGCSLGFWWELVMGMLLEDCDYIEVHEFGRNSYFAKIKNN